MSRQFRLSRILQGVALLAAAFLLPVMADAQCLPTVYHTRQEMTDFIFALQADYPQWVKVDSIGHSRGDQLGVQYPIYAVKISDNVQVFEDEPTALFICHIHAEEVIGFEASLDYMQKLTAQYQQYHNLVNNTQLYFIPTMNPDGLEVISRCLDYTWRKNGYHPPELGDRDCLIVPGVGEDSCGVDLNRNFDMNWIYGDTLWKRTNVEPFDYYRGPYPFSEPEAQAVSNFAIQIKPTVALVLHSSRQGGLANQSILAWQWGADPGPYKFPPDCTALNIWNHGYVAQTEVYPESGPYTHVWGGTHNGCLQDWFYWKLGTFLTTTETSPTTGQIQPDSLPLFQHFIPGVQPAIDWLGRRLLNLDQAGDMQGQGAPVSIYTYDSQSGQPISAEWRILNTWTALLPPRYTNEAFGRMTILPPPGPITVMARKEGYVPDTVSAFVNPGDSPMPLILNLQPLPWHNLIPFIRDSNGNSIGGGIHVVGEYTYDIAVPEDGTVAFPEGSYLATVERDTGRLVVWRSFWLGGDDTLDVTLSEASLAWSENFENGMTSWNPDGVNGSWRVEADTSSAQYGNSLCMNPPGFRVPYANNADTRIQYSGVINIPGGNSAYLYFDRRGRMDVPADSFLVEISEDGDIWEQAAGFSDLELGWTPTYVNLSTWASLGIQLRLRLKTDYALGDLGMHVDNLAVYYGTDLSTPEHPLPSPFSYRITGAYPNPFNPSTTIAYEVAGGGTITMLIYNVLGQAVRSCTLNPPSAGSYRLIWDGANDFGSPVPSGVYFVRLHAGEPRNVHKVLLIR